VRHFLRFLIHALTIVALAQTCAWCAAEARSANIGASGAQGSALHAPSAPYGLRCEYLVAPLAIDVRQPRFSWVLDEGERGASQSAYQVLVASSRGLLSQDRGDLWDSSKVKSANSTQVVYAGSALTSGGVYYWKVRWWDQDGRESAYSRPAKFGMGLLLRSDWKGEWIGGGNELRKEFRIPSAIKSARVYITALGYYELRINGRRVGHRVLDPAYTTYPKRVLYSTYDVTSELAPGPNVLGVMLGGGWATLSRGGAFKGYYEHPALLLQFDAMLSNGQELTVSSDRSWKVTQGPIVRDSVYDGEVYDARRETPGWDRPGFDAAGWENAQVVPGSSGTLSAEMMPPIRVVDEIVPKSVTNPEPGFYVYDMGQNMSGWARLRVRGPRGTRVTLRYSELLYPDGMINRANLRSAKSRDVFILKGGGWETFHAHFTYHGFRYVEVTGFPGTPGLDSLRGEVVHTAVQPAGSFVASKEILNRIQQLIDWSQLTNLMSIPTDCDNRDERQGWMGDAQVTAEEAMMNFFMPAFYTDFIRDIRDVEGSDGTVTDTVPHRYGSRPADPAWGTAYPVIVWDMWREYGDRRVLEENYDGLKKYVEFLRSRAPNNILSYSYYGDWVSLVPTPGAFVSACYYYYDVQILAQIARVLNRTPDEATYNALASRIKDAINSKFLDSQTGEYATGTQTANAMALAMGLVPNDMRGQVAGNLYNDVVYYHNTHVTTGFIGVRWLMPALTRTGNPDVAYELATRTSFPSWGYMIKKGATTLWELWQQKTGPSMNSQDHAMFGSVGAWFYKVLAGIDQQPGTAGYAHLLIEPQVVEDLHWASGSIHTMRGLVSSSWVHTPGQISLKVIVPVGSDATVILPTELQWTNISVRESGRPIWQAGRYLPGDPGVNSARQSRRGIAVHVGSGDYSFVIAG
jgi:alpha-L-rhamnosidase